MTTTPIVLAKSPDEPLCPDCAKALGLINRDAVNVTLRACSLCGNERGCALIGNLEPETAQRGYWRQPDDYSELESLLGRRG